MIKKMNGYLIIILTTGLGWNLVGQTQDPDLVKQTIIREETETHIRFLASNELRGRNTGSPEIDIAAKYIAEQLRRYGVKSIGGYQDYFQQVELMKTAPPPIAWFNYADKQLNNGREMAVLKGRDIELKGKIVFVGYGQEQELKSAKIKNKIVLARAGAPEINEVRKFFSIAAEKKKLIKDLGGLALVELYGSDEFPWNMLVSYLGGPKYSLDLGLVEDEPEEELPHIWIGDQQNEYLNFFEKENKLGGTLSISSPIKLKIKGRNVIGMIEGTDPELKNEYLALTAHYDHVGVQWKGDGQDSIYNGARDNAMGTVAIINAAKYFSQYPPKRSLLFLAVTAEEVGLLGSSWYREFPVIPYERTVFNLNTDGAGYNDTSIATILGLGRTNADQSIIKGCEAFGLKVGGDPAPEQNLYDRSDNVNFAIKGVPAITFSPGVAAFDEEINKYYHQPIDEVESMDFDYVMKFNWAFVYSAQLIANMETTPYWTTGDKYESAAKTLYGK